MIEAKFNSTYPHLEYRRKNTTCTPLWW